MWIAVQEFVVHCDSVFVSPVSGHLSHSAQIPSPGFQPAAGCAPQSAEDHERSDLLVVVLIEKTRVNSVRFRGSGCKFVRARDEGLKPRVSVKRLEIQIFTHEQIGEGRQVVVQGFT